MRIPDAVRLSYGIIVEQEPRYDETASEASEDTVILEACKGPDPEG